MGTLLSEINYGFGNGSKPVSIGQGDDKKEMVSYEDHITSLSTVEETIGQLVTQHNSALLTQEGVISDNIPASLNTGTATAGDCAAAINNLITLLTNLNSQPK